jgi:ubiquitin C-terminal hydrolase
MGNLNGGHYIYYHKFDDKWHVFDDSNISIQNNTENIINKGYIYLYERIR